MAKYPANERQTNTSACTKAREGVPQVVNAHIGNAREFAYFLPFLSETVEGRVSLLAGKHPLPVSRRPLPLLFKECKAVGAGMDQAKAMVEWVVQVTRVGLSGL